MLSRTTTYTLILLLALALLPTAAAASSKQLALFQDDTLLLNRGDGQRQATLAELQALGVDAIKAQLNWHEVAPGGRTKPAGFDGSDPGAYPGWGKFDAFVRDAQARGFQVMLAITGPAPAWATASKRDSSPGPGRPSASEFGRFAEAAGRRYPSVDIWTLWNEPNLDSYLFPQSTEKRVPYAPHRYREMVRSALGGLTRAGQGGDRILFGELLPNGQTGTGPGRNLKPLRFLREFFCLDSSWRPFRGRAAKLRGCQDYKRLTGVNGFAYHPYTRAVGPSFKGDTNDDATISSLGRITRALDLARRKRRIGGPRLRIWNTEFDFQSRPPDPFGSKLSRIPTFMSESEWIAYRNRRVATHSQYTMVDVPIVGGNVGTWQGGLRFADGREKRGVYRAYRLPLFVRLLGPSHVEVWGAARPGGAGATAQLQQRAGRGRFADLGRAIDVRNERGYFKARFQVSQAARRDFRFTSGGQTSWTAKAVFRP